MNYRDLQIQTQRDAPSNARTEGFSLLVRASYITRENMPTPLGEQALSRLRKLANETGSDFFSHLSLPMIGNDDETYFPISTGSTEIIHCPACGYASRLELAQFAKTTLPAEELLPIEKVLTPDCNTIQSLGNFKSVPKEKTPKALMLTRRSDCKFVFVVVRGDRQMSQAKLTKLIGEVRPATTEEISRSGAVAGFASPVGLQNALIIVDDLVPQSINLVAGANEAGYHLMNTNCGRDYTAELVSDLAQAKTGDACPNCGKPLSALNSSLLVAYSEINFEAVLSALAETHHDEKGLIFPKAVAPFDVYLMHLSGKELDTLASAEELYATLQKENIAVLFDDRNERAGVKFNDADLIGCPIRVTVGEKNLRAGMVELKPRTATENQLVSINEVVSKIKTLQSMTRQ